MNIKKVTTEDIDFLWDMLYEAIFVPPGEKRPSREILNQPDLRKYVAGWGRKGDGGFVAVNDQNQPIGAIWGRLFDETNKTYGYLDEKTPVISMAVQPEYRGQGIGTRLLDTFLNEMKKEGYTSVSLSVDPENPVVRLYERKGFIKVGVNGTSWDMKVSM